MRLKVLIIGGTGYIGKRLVKASLQEGHDTYVLQRSDIGVHVEKVQMLLSFKKQGAHLLIGSFNDHCSLVEAVKQVDVVICAISGVHIRTHQILLQLKLVDAIKEAGNIKRFLPSEFGMDPARMADAMEPGRVAFDDKMVVRKAIEDAGIPFTYVSANCFAGYFIGGLCQPGHILPSKDKRSFTKGSCGTLEKLIGKQLKKSSFSEQEFLNIVKDKEYAEQVGWTHYYDIFYKGCLANLEINGVDVEEASLLYPDIKYSKVEDYLRHYL
ncbi:NAD(P)-binding domain-containing protein [Cynara cardunculus var. scolymus]|uniref:(+)-lariciresinol reductase n=1 Tax=Cynara cardunculus var. scolymus TaxID=59895 RepID=A0A103XJ83_CYNCS|nr:NAD(P)-binding domain-containing protein [Cynara cardunculus var. scolymus]